MITVLLIKGYHEWFCRGAPQVHPATMGLPEGSPYDIIGDNLYCKPLPSGVMQ